MLFLVHNISKQTCHDISRTHRWHVSLGENVGLQLVFRRYFHFVNHAYL